MKPHSNSAVKPIMDIKNALNAVLPLSLRAKDNVTKTIKSDSTTDRDGNGQMPFGGGEQEKHDPMTDEQLEKALEHLRNLSAVKEHNLTVELSLQNEQRVVLIKEADGKVVRRIQEAELWSLQVMKGSEKTGQLLRKTA